MKDVGISVGNLTVDGVVNFGLWVMDAEKHFDVIQDDLIT